MRQRKTLKYARIGMGAILLTVLLYFLSSTIRVAGGISKVIDTPAHLMRLQVINDSGVEGLAKQVAERLSDYTGYDLEIMVVDVFDFNLRRSPKSFVVARNQDKTAARMLAEKIGLDPSEVVFQPLEHNHRQVSATLILGEDYETITLPQTVAKEI